MTEMEHERLRRGVGGRSVAASATRSSAPSLDLRWLVPCLMLGLLQACGASTPTSVVVGAAAPDGETVAMAAGEDAVLVVSLRPGRFSALISAARDALSEQAAEALSTLTLPRLLQQLMDAPVPDLERLDGFDLARPMLLRIGESAFALSDVTTAEAVPLRFVIALPASDVTRLAAALETHLGSCPSHQPHTYTCDAATLHVETTARWAFVVGIPNGAAPLATPLLATSPGPLDAWALDGPDGGFVVRGERVRPWFAASGLHRLKMALAYLDQDTTTPEDARAMRAIGTLEVTGAYAQMTGPGEIETLAARLDFERLRGAMVLQLSNVGAAAWQRARAPQDGDVAPTGERTSDIMLRASSNLVALFRQARPDSQQSAAERQRLRACGQGCNLRALLTPLASLRRLRSRRRPSFQVNADETLPPSTWVLRVTPPDARILRADALVARGRVGTSTIRLGAAMSESGAAAALAEAETPPEPAPTQPGTLDTASERCLAQLADAVTDLDALHGLVPEEHGGVIERLRARTASAAACVVAPQLRTERDAYLRVFEHVVSLLDRRPR